MGVIALDKRVFHYMLFRRSVDSEKFIRFLRSLRAKHGRGEIILYQDNLSVHKSRASNAVYQELNITPCYSPAYSPDYNPIENCFSKLKGKVKRLRLNDMLNKRKRTYD